MDTERYSRDDIEEWLVKKVAELTQTPEEEIDAEEPFADYGMSSMDAVNLSGELEEWLGIRLSPTLVFDYPTIDQMAQYLSEEKQ
ncbi:acyl carrier protein [Candidatus Uabimicrobium sp. HlEnr_7]|uniref:acyl carrier protein n=1 Tax=Candidatus Uabimicrobium helgolandensis TaxID=3095367 RepID=UPI003556EB6B